MRPAELDYSKGLKHYFDTANGDVLVGAAERREYVAQEGVAREQVADLGTLLRDAASVEGQVYEPLDTTTWDKDRAVEYGRWVRRIISQPEQGRRWLARQVFENGELLGVGPAVQSLEEEFGGLTGYFSALKLGRRDVYVRGSLDEWTLDDYVAYLQKIGNGKPPTNSQITKLARNDSQKPSVRHIELKYPDIKLRGLLQLAGFTGGLAVMRAWDREDYINWGVRFMQDNDGQVPNARYADYFAKERSGPSSAAIVDKKSTRFASMEDFQKEVAVRYWEKRADQEQKAASKLDDIAHRLERGTLPPTIFNEDFSVTDAINESKNLLQGLIRGADSEPLQNMLAAYGRYYVLERVAPNMTPERKIEIARTADSGKSFVLAIGKTNEVPEYEIEYTALTGGFFDDIWPLHADMPSLQLGSGYEEYLRQRNRKELERKTAARQRRRLQKSTV